MGAMGAIGAIGAIGLGKLRHWQVVSPF
jgi:hypothetical protein